jgi:hypothetical protein
LAAVECLEEQAVGGRVCRWDRPANQAVHRAPREVRVGRRVGKSVIATMRTWLPSDELAFLMELSVQPLAEPSAHAAKCERRRARNVCTAPQSAELSDVSGRHRAELVAQQHIRMSSGGTSGIAGPHARPIATEARAHGDARYGCRHVIRFCSCGGSLVFASVDAVLSDLDGTPHAFDRSAPEKSAASPCGKNKT